MIDQLTGVGWSGVEDFVEGVKSPELGRLLEQVLTVVKVRGARRKGWLRTPKLVHISSSRALKQI
jgi:hypothetical protein